MSAASYVNPFTGASSITAERIDQGQDFALTPGAPIRAIGRAKVLQVQPNWYEGQPAVFYELLDGPRKGTVIYDAEQIKPLVKPGQIVNAGQLVATYAASGTGLETGLGTSSGQTLAAATTGYTEGQVTPAGEAVSQLLAGLGVQTKTGSSSKSSGGGKCAALGPLSFVCKPAELAEEGANAALGLAGEGASAAGSAVGEGIINWVKPEATKLTLYGVLIFGAVAMMIFGLAELLKPVGGPNVGSLARTLAGGKGGKAGGKAGLAGEAEEAAVVA